LLRDHDAVFDSAPPIAAVLAADAVAGRGLDLLARIQTAHYVEGRRIAESSVLIDLAADIGLEEERFAAAFYLMRGESTQAHINESLALLAQAGGSGFPTFAIERGGRLDMLDSSAYLGRPDAWREFLKTQLPAA
jgi:putative protein-disulfide isomerase